jgi:poly(A) polymerase
LDADGLDACARELDGIDTLSKERIGHEVRKLLAAPDPAPSVAAMAQVGVLARVISGAVHTSLAPLIHLESTIDANPNWMRRLLALGGEDVQDALRLSKKEAHLLNAMKSAVSEAYSPRIAGYKLGAAAGLDATLVLHAHLGTPLPTGLKQELALGANAKFPIAAIDLADRFEGPALGTRLKGLEAAWINSGLRLSKIDLLKLSNESP